MRAVELIIAVDVMSRVEPLVYGRKLLSQLANRKTPNRELWTLRISLGMDSDELAKLLLLVFAAKVVVSYRPRPEANVS